MIDRGSLSPDQLRTANGGRLKSISPMSKSYQLTDSIEAPWRHSRSVFYFSLDTSFFFIDELYAPGANIDHRLGSRSVMELTLTVFVKD